MIWFCGRRLRNRKKNWCRLWPGTNSNLTLCNLTLLGSEEIGVGSGNVTQMNLSFLGVVGVMGTGSGGMSF